MILGGVGLQETQIKSIREAMFPLGIEVFASHTGNDHSPLVEQMINKGYRIVITQVAADGLTEEWLGKELTKENFEKLKKVTLIILQHFLWSEALKWEKFLKRIKGVSVLIVHSSSIPNVWNVLVSHKHGTKRHAAKKLQVLLGVKKSETIAVGDGHNDLDMFKQAGLKVAMGNAVHELKKEADYFIKNSGTLSDLKEEIKELVKKISND